jgi:hypothetical protein
MITELRLDIEQIAQEYDWIEYQQLEGEKSHLWVVLRTLRNEYVVHLYNSEVDGHYYGVYCGSDLTKATQVYQEKIAFYRDKKRPRPENLMEALGEVRSSNSCNMNDLKTVIHLMSILGYHPAAKWLYDNANRYADVLMEFTEWLQTHPPQQPKSLAQQLAEEMGWKVIVD